MNTSIEAAISIFCHLKRGFLAWPLSLLLNPHLHTDILRFHRLQCERPVCCSNGEQRQQHGLDVKRSPARHRHFSSCTHTHQHRCQGNPNRQALDLQQPQKHTHTYQSAWRIITHVHLKVQTDIAHSFTTFLNVSKGLQETEDFSPRNSMH